MTISPLQGRVPAGSDVAANQKVAPGRSVPAGLTGLSNLPASRRRVAPAETISPLADLPDLAATVLLPATPDQPDLAATVPPPATPDQPDLAATTPLEMRQQNRLPAPPRPSPASGGAWRAVEHASWASRPGKDRRPPRSGATR